MAQNADVIIIGGGIAGAGAAYEAAAFASVILIEREFQCGYHATGRSAASFTENYGNRLIRRLAIASRRFLEEPPGEVSDRALLAPRGMITIARADQLESLELELAEARRLVPSIECMSAAAAVGRVPVLRRDYVAGALVEPHSMELDVGGLHQGFLRGARRRGATILTSTPVEHLERRGLIWQVGAGGATYSAPSIVNAAGAWADEIARMAGAAPVGLVAKRRTAFNIAAPTGIEVRGWPMVNDVGGEFYFKPDAGQLFVSPADATPSAPVDAQPEDIDVATGVERLERATTLSVTRVARAWAGLRTFAADDSPVLGPDGGVDGFFWLAGQGGYGIKTSPALSRACAALLRGGPLPADLAAAGIGAAELSPQRLRRAAAGMDAAGMDSRSATRFGGSQ